MPQDIKENTHAPESQKSPREIQRLLSKADHLNTAGSLTSMISTALWLFENTFEKKPHRIINGVTLGALVAGIGAMIASVCYKLKAGPYIVYHRHAECASEAPEITQPIASQPPVLETAAQPPVPPRDAARPSWVQKNAAGRETRISAPPPIMAP